MIRRSVPLKVILVKSDGWVITESDMAIVPLNRYWSQ
jgi:hypothetical protein